MPGLTLRPIDVLVEAEAAAGEPRIPVVEPAHRTGTVRPADHPRRRDRSGVDHRVEGRARVGMQADAVEPVPGRLHPDASMDLRLARRLEDERIGERLRQRLDRERPPRVADLVQGPVHRRDRDPERIGVGARELRDVRRDGPVPQVRVPGMEAREVGIDGRPPIGETLEDGPLTGDHRGRAYGAIAARTTTRGRRSETAVDRHRGITVRTSTRIRVGLTGRAGGLVGPTKSGVRTGAIHMDDRRERR